MRLTICISFAPSLPRVFCSNKTSQAPLRSEGLVPAIVPVFPLERSITVKCYSVRRKQIHMCPAFCLTDYKVQGSTLDSAILDLKDDPMIRGRDRHQKFCSTYVQLS